MPYRNVFVTVGSTVFDDLVHAVLAKPVMDQLRDLGCESLLIQQGHASIVDRETVRHGIRVTSYHYATSLQQDLQQASLVISHGRAAFVYTRTVAHHVLAPLAGTGSILETLRMGKPLIVVVNEALMHNHQSEISAELSKRGHVLTTTPSALASDMRLLEKIELVPLPPPIPQLFTRLLDHEFGYI